MADQRPQMQYCITTDKSTHQGLLWFDLASVAIGQVISLGKLYGEFHTYI